MLSLDIRAHEMIGEMQDPKIAAPHRCLDRYARDRQIGRFLYRESISGPRPVARQSG